MVHTFEMHDSLEPAGYNNKVIITAQLAASPSFCPNEDSQGASQSIVDKYIVRFDTIAIQNSRTMNYNEMCPILLLGRSVNITVHTWWQPNSLNTPRETLLNKVSNMMWIFAP